MEIYTLTISFPYDETDEPWSKTIEVKENFTLQELHKYIQKIVEFDDDHLYEFSIRRTPRSSRQAISKTTKLNNIYPLSGEKLYYLFDFGDSWLFEIKKQRKKKLVENGKIYPRIIESTGVNPEQYPEYELD